MVDISFLFTTFPYVAVAIAVIGSVYRYFTDRFSYSSQSSQFLESKELFLGSLQWHYGIILVLLSHTGATLLAPYSGLILADPIVRDLIRMLGPILGLSAAFGLVMLIIRRLSNVKVRSVTSRADWVMLLLLLVQVALGLSITFFYRWGSTWYPYTATPWLVSLATFNPQPQFVEGLPLIIQFHFLNPFLIIAIIPFTSLVHLFTVPITYIWRPYQVVIWNRRKNTGVQQMNKKKLMKNDK